MGAARSKISKVSNHLSLFGYLRSVSREEIELRRKSKIFQNLYIRCEFMSQ